jgi:hypothetical protein
LEQWGDAKSNNGRSAAVFSIATVNRKKSPKMKNGARAVAVAPFQSGAGAPEELGN